ncbi:MAG: DUF937 domain-containing protein [Lachnospiraceae bacterium]|nr:DUF937 domain-containing protein [Lachnospiraceae bacterium]
MNLLSLLTGSLTSGTSVEALAGKTGISTAKLIRFLPVAVPVLLKFLTKNASSVAGAQALLGALGGHKETRAMADQIAEADEQDGAKIVKHILGDESPSVVSSLAKDSEMEDAEVEKALANIAPAMMSGLSAATSSAAKVNLSDGLDLSDLMGMFGGTAQAASKGSSLLGGLLGGGKEAVGGIGGILGGLFGGKEQEKDEDDGNALLGILTSLIK